MGHREYEKAIELINKHSDLLVSYGKVDINIINKAKKKLNVNLPADYIDFLSRYGAINFGSEEIYGIISTEFYNSSIPDAIWYTLKEREESSIPKNFIIIYESGYGELFCISTDYIDIDPPIKSFIPGLELFEQPFEIISESFGSFLLEKIESEIKLNGNNI